MYLAQRGYKVANIPVVPGQAGYMTRVEVGLLPSRFDTSYLDINCIL
jgi:hypothetical protein